MDPRIKEGYADEIQPFCGQNNAGLHGGFCCLQKTLSDLIFQKKSFYGRSMNSPIVGGSEYEYRIVKNRIHLGPVLNF